MLTLHRMLCLGLALLAGLVRAQAPDPQLMAEAFHYTYPLYKLSDYRWTALHDSTARTHTALNAFAHSREITSSKDRWANAPIVDALYSTAWVDLAAGPVTIETPAPGTRYHVLTLIDFYSNTFFYAGPRATGSAAQRLYLVGPDWQGEAPAGTRLVRAPTSDVYLNLRVLVDGSADLPAANRVQDGFHIVPAQASAPQRPRVQPLRDEPHRYLDVINDMLERNPPPPAEQAELQRFAAVGLCGRACRWEWLGPALQQAWRTLLPRLQAGFMQTYLQAGAAQGWIDYSPKGSLLGTDQQKNFTQRAYALALGMGMLGLQREEASYWITLRDGDGQPLHADGRYRLRLPPGGIPVQAFWSISLYTAEPEGQFLHDNALQRHHVGSRTGLVANADGSIDVLIQPAPPADTKYLPNWLPTPRAGLEFELFARAYIPNEEVLAGTFKMPPVERQR